MSLEGKDAARAFRLLDHEGPEPATVFLSQWDEGTATDNEAMIQRMTRRRLPIEPSDRAISVDAYTIIANPAAGRIAMYRLHDDEPNTDIIIGQERFTHHSPARAISPAPTVAADPPPRQEQTRTRHAQKSALGRSWFDPPTTGSTSQSPGRGRSL